MESKSLMIGDWVTFKDCQHENPMPIKIIAIGFQADGENDCLVQIDGDKACDIIEIDDEIVGIPLTAEILEKNGFRHGSYVGGYYSTDCPFRVFTKAEGKCEFTALFDDEIHFSCVFVHQLQHSLRLCGIEKEIVL